MEGSRGVPPLVGVGAEVVALRLQEVAERLRAIDASLAALAQRQARAAAEWQGAPSDDALRAAHADAAARERELQAARSRLDEAERQLRAAAEAFQTCRDTLATDAADLRLPTTTEALEAVGSSLVRFGETLHTLLHGAPEVRLTATELAQQQARTQEAEADARQIAEQAAERRLQAEEAQVRLATLRESIGARVGELQQRLHDARNAVSEGERDRKGAEEALRGAGEARARGEQKMQDADATLQERAELRQRAIAQLQGFAATGLLSAALPDAELPDLRAPWTIEPALNLARRTEQALAHVTDDDAAWTRIQSQISHDYGELGRALSALGQQAQADTSDYGMVVSVVYQNRPERPDRLTARLDAEIAQRRELLTARERTLLENHLQAEIAAELVRAGLAVHIFNQRTVAGILDMIAVLGGMIGAGDKAAALIGDLERGLADIRAATGTFSRRPRVYFEEWDDPMISAIGWVSELIGIAGGEDCFPELAAERAAKGRIVADPLEVARRAPDIVIGSWCGKAFRAEQVCARGGWQDIPAVRSGHVVEVKSAEILQPGPAALTDGVRRLHTIVSGWAENI